MANENTSTETADNVKRSVREIIEFVESLRSIAGNNTEYNLEVAFLRKVKEIVDRVPQDALDAATPTGGGSVLFALDPSTTQWAAAGSDQQETELWKALNVDPEMVKVWKDAGLSVEVAARWKNARPYYFNVQNINPQEVVRWEKTTIPTSMAISWMNAKVSPEAAQIWTELGGDIEDGKQWLGCFQTEDPEKVFNVSLCSLNVKEVKGYQAKGISFEDAPIFSKKGYTPHAAMKLLEKGISAEAAPDKTNGAPVPGKAWPKIKKAADMNGWTVTSVETMSSRRGYRPAKITKVTFSKPSTPHGEVYAEFENTRFIRGTKRTNSYWREHTNTITGLLKDYLI